MPLIFELPMVLFTRAVLLFNHAKCVLSRGRDALAVVTAATLYREAAGLFDYILELMNTNLMDGIEPPASIPDLSLDVLQSMQGVSLATVRLRWSLWGWSTPVVCCWEAPTFHRSLLSCSLVQAQQLSIVKAVFHCEKLYSKSVLVKLHSGCHASFEAFEAALVRNCSNSTTAAGSALLAVPSRHAKTLLAFASFFAKLHRAQTFLLTAELEYQARKFGRAIGFLATARRLFQERWSMGGVGLSPLPSGCERLASLLSTRRTALEQLLAAWTHENDSIYFDAVPGEATVLTSPMSQAFIMKPQSFDASRDAVVGVGLDDGVDFATDDSCDNDTERIQVLDEHSDEENGSESASESEVYLERVVTARISSTSAPVRVRVPVVAAHVSKPSKRESLVTALSDALRAAHPESDLAVVPVAAPRRRQSERAPSMTPAQIATLAERAAARKLSAGVAYTTEASKARAEILAAQERFKMATIQVDQPTKLTSEASEQMRAQLAQGKPIFRRVKDSRVRPALLN